ncbi:hypothetical protein EN801_039290, partial [Mesorhizobium sp. M00.F.Ca.ET.158.01.1.1]
MACAVRAIATLGRADPEKLLKYTPVPKSGKLYEVADETFVRLAINRTYFRFCAHCVREDMDRYDGPLFSRPWLRLEWTLSHFRSCSRHEIYLTATKPIRTPFAPFDFSDTIRTLMPSLSQVADAAAASGASP